MLWKIFVSTIFGQNAKSGVYAKKTYIVKKNSVSND